MCSLIMYYNEKKKFKAVTWVPTADRSDNRRDNKLHSDYHFL